MKYQIIAFVATLSIIAAGCAKKSDDISARYISPLQYDSYSCRQIGEEAQRVTNQAARLTGLQDKKAQNDAVATGVALVLFWPAAFFIGGNGENAAELGHLKGELEALERASIKKNCSIAFRTAAPKTPAKAVEAPKPVKE
jgi:hypothetical protein